MSGMHGISSSSGMSKNCGMEGMHGNSKNSETKKPQYNEEDHKNIQTKIPDNIRGKAIDIQI